MKPNPDLLGLFLMDVLDWLEEEQAAQDDRLS